MLIFFFLLFYFISSAIIAYVTQLEAPTVVGRNQQYTVFKFMLSNKQGRTIQCSAWDNDIPAVVERVQIGRVSIVLQFFFFFLIL